MPCQCRPNAVPMVSWIAKCQFCHMLSMACRVVRVGFRAGPDTRAPDEWFEAFNDDRVIHPYLDEGQSDKSRIPT